MTKTHRIVVKLPDSVYADLQSFKRDRSFNTDSTSVMSLVVRGLYDWNLRKCNTNVQAGAGCCGSPCVTTSPPPSA